MNYPTSLSSSVRSYDNSPSRPSFAPLPFLESLQRTPLKESSNEITKLKARQLSLETEKELLMREGRRLKEEIEYLNEKCSQLQERNEQRFKEQSRTAILQREYHRVLAQLEQQRSNCRIMHGNQIDHITNLPTKIEPAYSASEEDKLPTEYYRLKAREPSNRFSRSSNKVSWKKTSGSSPIYKLDQYRKYSGNRLEEVSLIQSKIDKVREEMEREREEEEGNRDHTKTIDLKDLEKNKDYELNRALESEVREIRNKNIALYKKSEEYEQQRLKLLEDINELNYEKSKLLAQQRAQDNEHRKEVEKLRLSLEESNIRIIELKETIANKEEAIKLAHIQRNEIEERMRKGQAKQDAQLGKTITELKASLEKSEKQLANIKERWQSLTKRQEQLQIENKLHIHQLEDKRSLIAQLQAQLERLIEVKQKPISLEEESILSKTENKAQRDYRPIEREEIQISKATQTDSDNRLADELAMLKEAHTKVLQEHSLWGFQLNKLGSQNAFINDNYLKLSKLYEQEKVENTRLKELSAEWREIEARAKAMKRLDQTIDHLWQIKEVEYENVHHILQRINQS